MPEAVEGPLRLANRTTLDNVFLARVVNAACFRWPKEDVLVVFDPSIAETCSGVAWRKDVMFEGSVAQVHIRVPKVPRFPQYPPSHRNRSGGLGFTIELKTFQ